jgi:hypothetical protein
MEENMPMWTEKALTELSIVRSWFKHDKPLDVITRPVYRSDFNWTNYATRAQLRCVLGLMVIREMPIKNFYVRCWITYAWMVFVIIRGNARGLRHNRPIVMYNHGIHAKALVNYPDFFYWNLTKVIPKNPPVPNANREWRMRQTPVYHQYHKNAFRYRLRKPRYVPWDGTMNQPIMPYMVDTGTDVINGTFKRNCNSTP